MKFYNSHLRRIIFNLYMLHFFFGLVYVITEKHSKNTKLKILSKNTAAFSIRILKSSRDEKREKMHLKSIFRVSYYCGSTLGL